MRSVVILLVVLLAVPALPCFSFSAKRPGPVHSASALPATASQVAGAMTPGKLIERVVTLSDARQSYALYLPSSYQPDKSWPILYCFDPVARGAVPVALFREAAEQYGWIVVGSNNSRNGPLDQSLAAINTMWEDTQKRFAVDGRRVYTAGFSGGARVAVRVNYLCRGCVAGVIACGAGFPPDIKPAASLPFAVFGMAGIDDFNFPELKLLDNTLEQINAAHRLAVFDGGHQWATKEISAVAVEWMELQAIKTQRRKQDEALVERFWQKRTAEARGLAAAGRDYDTYKAVVALVSDFRGLRDVSEFESQMVQLKEAKVIKQALRDEQEEINLQRRKAAELVSLVEGRKDADNRLIAVANFRHAVEALRKQAREEEDSSRRRVARRALNGVFAQYYEGALNLRQRPQDAALMVTTLEIAAEIAPHNPQVHYQLACAYALNTEKKKALAALKRAVEKGFNDVATLTTDQALDSIRAEDEYKTLVEQLKVNP